MMCRNMLAAILLLLAAPLLGGCWDDGNNTVAAVEKLSRKVDDLALKMWATPDPTRIFRDANDSYLRALQRDDDARREHELRAKVARMSGDRRLAVEVALQTLFSLEDDRRKGWQNKGVNGEALGAHSALQTALGGYEDNAWASLKRGLWGEGADHFSSLYAKAQPVVLYFIPERYVRWLEESEHVLLANPDWNQLQPVFETWFNRCRYTHPETKDLCEENIQRITSAFNGRQLSENDLMLVGFLSRRNAEGGPKLVRAMQTTALDVLERKRRPS